MALNLTKQANNPNILNKELANEGVWVTYKNEVTGESADFKVKYFNDEFKNRAISNASKKGMESNLAMSFTQLFYDKKYKASFYRDCVVDWRDIVEDITINKKDIDGEANTGDGEIVVSVKDKQFVGKLISDKGEKNTYLCKVAFSQERLMQYDEILPDLFMTLHGKASDVNLFKGDGSGEQLDNLKL